MKNITNIIVSNDIRLSDNFITHNISSTIINKTINDVIDNSKFDKLFNLINIRSIFNMGVSHG